MKVWIKIYKNQRIAQSYTAENENEDITTALLDCMEEACKALDLAEPVWVSKHTKDLSMFRRTKLFPDDFMEPVDFDYCTVEII